MAAFMYIGALVFDNFKSYQNFYSTFNKKA